MDSVLNYWFIFVLIFLLVVSSPTIGTSTSNPGRSCKQIKDAFPSSQSGFYYINPGGSTIQVYCDMWRDGGGWTMGMLS
jgi:hypothetical protein